MANHEHLLTIIEPVPGGDTTLDLAHETVERGGTARVVMVITDRVRRDISAFAKSENLDLGDAETLALDRLRAQCVDRVGGSPTVETYFGNLAVGLRNHLTDGTTAIAVPKQLGAGRRVRRAAAKAGIPLIVTPKQAA